MSGYSVVSRKSGWFFCKNCETIQTQDGHGNLFVCCDYPKIIEEDD